MINSVTFGHIDGRTQRRSALVGITHVMHLAARKHIIDISSAIES